MTKLYVLYKNGNAIKTSFKLMELLNIIKEYRKENKKDLLEIEKIENK